MLVILLTYLMGTNFFWMFVEGLYLYILVVKTFSIELVKVHIYVFIGWGMEHEIDEKLLNILFSFIRSSCYYCHDLGACQSLFYST